MTQKLKIVIEVSSILGFAFKVPYTLFQETDLNMLSSYILLHLYPGGGGILDINLVQVCRWASTDPPYKCILAYGKGIPINVYTITEDNKKCSLLPFR